MKKLTTLLFISIILLSTGCDSSNEIENVNQLKISSSTYFKLSDINKEDKVTKFTYKLKDGTKGFAIYTSIDNIEVKASNNVKTVKIDNIDVKEWITGSIIHFLWKNDSANFYLKGDLLTGHTPYQTYLKIVDLFIPMKEMPEIILKDELVLNLLGTKREDNIKKYIFGLGKDNEEGMALHISNKPMDFYHIPERTNKLNIKNKEVNQWIGGTVIHFEWKDMDTYYYLTGNAATIAYDKYHPIVEFMIDHRNLFD